MTQAKPGVFKIVNVPKDYDGHYVREIASIMDDKGQKPIRMVYIATDQAHIDCQISRYKSGGIAINPDEAGEYFSDSEADRLLQAMIA